MPLNRTKPQESRAAIQRLYIAMRHLFIRGSYKPLGVSGESMIEALMQLGPEIYGSIADPEKVELKGLLYIFERLPRGIEECRYVRLISREGYEESHFEPIVPAKRRRNCYRIDDQQMFIEMTRGRSDIYDVLTHLTFMYIEAEKIRHNATDQKGRPSREWLMLEQLVLEESQAEDLNREVAYTYLSTLLGRSFRETVQACQDFDQSAGVNSIFHITYWLGKRSFDETDEQLDREISFSSDLREKIGHHTYGEYWANHIKSFLVENGLFERPLHIISANLHSVMNLLYAEQALLTDTTVGDSLKEKIETLSQPRHSALRAKVARYASDHGMHRLDDLTGTNISVQIFDLALLMPEFQSPELPVDFDHIAREKPLLLVMDYAFGEQAFETMDELLKPFEEAPENPSLNVASISIMGKAGILCGNKGEIMLPTAYVFEGTTDNYPLDNDLTIADFSDQDIPVFEGPMITVLGTSLQNQEVLRFFLESSWKAIGLEMEGAHYQKAIQAASRIRNSIDSGVKLRYAYYASDNPLLTGHTLASGSLGLEGVQPTYVITRKILEKIIGPSSTAD